MLIHVYSSQSTTSPQVGSEPTDICGLVSVSVDGFGAALAAAGGWGGLGAAGGGGFVGVGSRSVVEENPVFVGLTGLAGVLVTAAYDFVAFPDGEGCALSVGGVGAGIVGGGHGGGYGSVDAVSSVGLGGVGPCVGDGPGWVVVVVGVVAGGVGSTSRCS